MKFDKMKNFYNKFLNIFSLDVFYVVSVGLILKMFKSVLFNSILERFVISCLFLF